MTKEQWNQAKQVLDEALERPPERRAAFVDEACADEPEVRREVEALLAASDEADGFFGGFERGAAEALVGMEGGFAADLDGHIGAYRIERELARGGMGTVYLAARADGQFEQQVALKVLHRGLDTDYLLQHFLAERQILASLSHPGIARVFDGGVTEPAQAGGGQPYFVMEYVNGQSLTDYCDTRRLTVRERLRLFLRVTDAVQHAHQRLVIHRDLKPSNILVAEADGQKEPQMKLLDFGVAKLLDAGAFGFETQPLTQRGQHWLTPEYASPEQVRGEAVTTATDVYALGVVLYELLTGCRPYTFETRAAREVERVVAETTPPAPSTQVEQATEGRARSAQAPGTPAAIGRARRLSPARLSRRLRGDLDTIVMKALRKEPGRRYATAEALADDVQRHLGGLPVHARRETVRYRAGKFVRRHRAGVAVAVVMALLLLSYAATVTVQADRIAEERDRAQTEAAKAEQVATFLAGLFEAGDPGEAPGDTVTAQDMLGLGVERIGDLKEQPDVQAEMLTVIGGAYIGLGRYEEAEPLVQRAVDIRRALYDRPDSNLARSLAALGMTLRRKGDFAGAESAYREALAMNRALYRSAHPDVAESTDGLGTVLRRRGNHAEAEALLREALAMRQALGAQDRLGAEPVDVAQSQNNLALLLLDEGQYAEAEALFREALAANRRLLSPDHPSLTINLYNIALALQRQGDYAAAEPLYRDVVARDRRVLGSDHPEVGIDLAKLAGLLRDKGDYAAADSAYDEALAHLRRTLPAGHPRTAEAMVGQGMLRALQGRPAEAEPLLREGQRAFEATVGAGHWLAANARSWLGHCLTQRERYAEAEPLLLEAHETLRTTRGLGDPHTQQALRHLAALYEAQGQADRARQYRLDLARSTSDP